MKNLKVYDWKNQEPLLMDWFFKMARSGEMPNVFMNDMQYMSTFLTFFRNNAILGYQADEDGIWFAFWVQKWLDGCIIGCWIKPGKRHSKAALECFQEAMADAFETYPYVLCITKQEHLEALLTKLGFEKGASINKAWSGDDVSFYVSYRE